MSSTSNGQKQPKDKSADDVDFSTNTDEITSFASSLSVPNEKPGGENTPKKRSNPPSAAGKSTGERRNHGPKFKIPYKILAAPDDLLVAKYTIQPSKITCFSGSNHFLSSLYKAQFEMNGIRYQSPEHYYQATKLYALCGYEVAARIQYVREPFKAKTVTKGLLRQYGVPHQSVEAWKQTDGLVTLMYAAALKFIQNQELREKLLDTKDNLIVEAHTDHFFAVGMHQAEFEKWVEEHAGQTIKIPYTINEHTLKHFPMLGKGQNLLGVILMKVRHELTNANASDLQDHDTVARILANITS